MKKKYFHILFLASGLVLAMTGIGLAASDASGKDIIGGADFPTFLFLFSHEKGGLYSALSLIGIAIMMISLLCLLRKTHK